MASIPYRYVSRPAVNLNIYIGKLHALLILFASYGILLISQREPDLTGSIDLFYAL